MRVPYHRLRHRAGARRDRRGETGLLVDFFSPDQIARTILGALAVPERYEPLRAAAARLVAERFDAAAVGVPGWLDAIDR